MMRYNEYCITRGDKTNLPSNNRGDKTMLTNVHIWMNGHPDPFCNSFQRNDLVINCY